MHTIQSALLICTPLYKLVASLQGHGCVPKLIHNLGQRTVCLVFYSLWEHLFRGGLVCLQDTMLSNVFEA